MGKISVPHLIQYQGSKRKLAPVIAHYLPEIDGRFVEPFCGVCSMSLYLAAHKNFKGSFVLNDLNAPLIDLLSACINDPDRLSDHYEMIWNRQFKTDPTAYFYQQRETFNQNTSPALTLYMLGRIVKGSLRYDQSGRMNQGCDKRRFGPSPEHVRKRCTQISLLLKNRSQLICGDYKAVLENVEPSDFVYFDSPYIGTSKGRDKRYISGISYDEFVDELKKLSKKISAMPCRMMDGVEIKRMGKNYRVKNWDLSFMN